MQADSDGDSIPDDCDDDADNDGIPDECDIDAGIESLIKRFWSPTSGGNGNWYAIVDDLYSGTWGASRLAAIQLYGGQLASITSQEESDFINSPEFDEQISAWTGARKSWWRSRGNGLMALSGATQIGRQVNLTVLTICVQSCCNLMGGTTRRRFCC